MGRRGTKKNDGFDSNYERRLAKYLPADSVREGIKVPYVIEKNSLPDWYIASKKYFVEAKGYMDGDERRKQVAINKAIKTLYPDHTYLLVLEKPGNKTSKTAKQTYGDWATKNGITWIGEKDFFESYKSILNLQDPSTPTTT